MAKKSTVTISVVAETKKFRRAMRQLGDLSGITALTGGIKKLSGHLLQVSKYAATAGAALSTITVKAAADLEQSAGAVQDVFKQYAGTVQKYSGQAATSVGLSANAYNELATLIGTQLKNGGTSMDMLAGKTNNLISLGADLAAGFGGSTADAVSALSSALKGERDPIERYGVSLTQAAIDAEAARLGFEKVGGALSTEANQAATLSLIMSQTSDFHGKFAAENDTLAHQLQVVKAKLTDMAATFGTLMLPIITQVVAFMSEQMTPAFEAFMGWLADNAIPKLHEFADIFASEWLPRLQEIWSNLQTHLLPVLQEIGTFIATTLIPILASIVNYLVQHSAMLVQLSAVILGAVVAWRAVTTVIGIINAVKLAIGLWKAVTTGMTIAQNLLNTAMLANPIGLIIIAITAVIAALVLLWNNCEGFRNAVMTIWDAVQSGFNTAIGFITGLIDGFVKAIQSIGSFFAGVGASVSRTWASVKSFFATGINNIKTTVSNGITNVVNFFTSLPSRILGAIGNIGNLLYDAGKSVIDGFINGIKGMWDTVKNTLGKLTSWLPDWKGPASVDRRILFQSGKLVMGGFIDGLENQYGAVRSSLAGLTGSLDGAIAMPAYGYGGALLGAAQIVINVNSLVPTIETGRLIANTLNSYLAVNRGRTTS
ncbi:MAG: hypothetical protein PUK59_07120 [Actinomycetaceae bacterium]|nr:hypothetical protein [Actinomycetaceae bacterium]MDY5854942.1 hypothetical protein [Arcanobacterium sp.]